MFSSALPPGHFHLGGSELLLIFLIVLLLFWWRQAALAGARRPRSVDQGIQEGAARGDEAEPATPTDAAKPAETKKTGGDTPTHGAN